MTVVIPDRRGQDYSELMALTFTAGNARRRVFLLVLVSLLMRSLGAAQLPARAWTEQDKEIWKKAVKRVVTTPPCCGACGILSMDEGRQAYRYVLGEDLSPEAEKIYRDNEKKLKEAFRYFSPDRYEHWFGPPDQKDLKK